MRVPIRERNWKPIINRLIRCLDQFGDCREKRMVQLYLEELKYRFWHHKVGSYYTCTDVDFVEYRYKHGYPEIVGLIEVKTSQSIREGDRTASQKQVLTEISGKLKAPLYIVTFSNNLKQFTVEPVNDQKHPRFLNEKQFISFLRNL